MYSFINIAFSAMVMFMPAGKKAFSHPGIFSEANRPDSVLPIRISLSNLSSAKIASVVSVKDLLESKTPSRGMLGFSQKGRLIDAWYFPGTSSRKALVIGGMHGSELSSIAVADALVEQLLKAGPGYYSVIVIPCLFPDNATAAGLDPAKVGGPHNTGRYSNQHAADPNRQMPSPRKAFRPDLPLDHLGRTIEHENQLLLDIITQLKPERIANIHAIRDEAHAGIYADPRTDSKGMALGFETDSSLAVRMAMHVTNEGGSVPGNNLDKQPSALYYRDPVPAPAGMLQKRNTCGSNLPGKRGHGISMGSWASTAVEDTSYPAANRDAIRLITIEFPGYKAPLHYTDAAQQQHCAKNVGAFASAIRNVFLGEK
jgi:hypothetical protein